jgi:hypothetical protein
LKTITLTDLRRQAWDTVKPETVLVELRQKRYQLRLEGLYLLVEPNPCERLTYLVRKHKPALLDLLAREAHRDPYTPEKANPIKESCLKLFRAHGWPESGPAREEIIKLAEAFDACYQWHDMAGLRRCWAEIEQFYQKQAAQDYPPEVSVEVQQWACEHTGAQHYRVRTTEGTLVKLLCPACGKNLKGPRRIVSPRKRSDIPWWNDDGQVQADPDAEVDELIEWWGTVEHETVDHSEWTPGVTVLESNTLRQKINNLIADWKLGGAAPGLEAQLRTHKAFKEAGQKS